MKLAHLMIIIGAAITAIAGACSQDSTAPATGAQAASTTTGGGDCDPDDQNDMTCPYCGNPNISYLPTCVNGAWLCLDAGASPLYPKCVPTTASSGGGGGAGGSGGSGGASGP